ncbi:hypothetical protein LR48_Vigan07g258400 [Vigna angularis]|uniref:Calcineurin B-like protein n=1 Tax=Phaseolus angularis TaxID=3914 RepID=A0A0L9V172_PHAAN|nr:hypothetical protein LR48_Vigan07g258400 [Vigna angularis]
MSTQSFGLSRSASTTRQLGLAYSATWPRLHGPSVSTFRLFGLRGNSSNLASQVPSQIWHQPFDHSSASTSRPSKASNSSRPSLGLDHSATPWPQQLGLQRSQPFDLNDQVLSQTRPRRPQHLGLQRPQPFGFQKDSTYQPPKASTVRPSKGLNITASKGLNRLAFKRPQHLGLQRPQPFGLQKASTSRPPKALTVRPSKGLNLSPSRGLNLSAFKRSQHLDLKRPQPFDLQKASTSRPPVASTVRPSKGLNLSSSRGLNLSASRGLNLSATTWPSYGLTCSAIKDLNSASKRPHHLSLLGLNISTIRHPQPQLIGLQRPQLLGFQRPPPLGLQRPQSFGHFLASKGLNSSSRPSMASLLLSHIRQSTIRPYDLFHPASVYAHSASTIRSSSSLATNLWSFGLYYSAFYGLELRGIRYRAFSNDYRAMAGLALVVALWNLSTTALALPSDGTLGTTARPQSRAILIESDMNLPDDLLDAIVDKTIADVDKDSDGKISKEDWKAFVSENPSLLMNMTLPYLKYDL